ncbi:MAG: UvrD-helicase domain-containing protein, partial [Myxococcales bacterium]|nr:UvrD-helicase domain-containing protein [Myxococcales bacterium]
MSAPDLNPAQHQAVNTLKGPMLVLAGAGSGKTRVITFRIANLIRNGIRPDRILAVTFTNKAAKEMRERAVGLLGKRRKKGDKAPEISTFHSLCVRILRRNIDQLGYPNEFPIYDRSDQESLARSALRDIRVGHDRLRPGDLLHLIGGWKSQSVRPEQASEVAKSDKELLAALAYAKYQDNLRASGAVDFDDLLLLTEELLDKFPDVRVKESGRFDHLLIDEYQDTNGLQYRIVRRLAERHRNLCVVGDDDQSIYGWRGAEVEHVLNFKNDCPEATVVRLESNYRSREAILKLANTLIAHNSTRHDKVLKPYRKGGEPPRFIRFEDETTEAHAVVREIRARLDNPPQDKRVYPSEFAILFRTNEQPRAFEVELRRHQVPYVLVGGQSFYDRKEVRDVMAYLKVLAFPRDEVALLRIINTPARGIGSGTIKSLVQSAVDQGRQLWEVLSEVRQNTEFTPVVIDRVDGFRKLIEHYKRECEREGSDLVDTVRELLQQIDYKAELQRLYDNPADVESRLNAIEEVVNALGSYVSRAETPSLRGFLEEMALSTRDDMKDGDDKKKKEAVTLMTLHSAKGLEFPHVYMVGMEEGILPHARSVLENKSVDEERRLAYVGVTRAQDTLTLTFCKGRMKWGKLRASIPSRFVMEMRGETERANRAAEAARAMFEQAAAFAQKKEDEKTKKAQKKTGKRSVRPPAADGPASALPRSVPPASPSAPPAAAMPSADAIARAGALPRALAEGLSGPAAGPVQDGFDGATISLRPGADSSLPDPKQRAALAALRGL